MNIVSARKIVHNKNELHFINWSDHAYAQFINKYALKLTTHKNSTAYYVNENKTKELVFLYNDTECTKKVFLSTKF